MNKHDKFPYQFNEHACKTCPGNCCRGATGYVWVSNNEVEKIAQIKGMSIDDFSQHYLRRVAGRLSLQERLVNGEYLCCFFDPIHAKCMIYQQRPKQCRTFPFWNHLKDDLPELFAQCPGVTKR